MTGAKEANRKVARCEKGGRVVNPSIVNTTDEIEAGRVVMKKTG